MSTTIAPTVDSRAAALQESLVELIDLSLQAKHYHWNVTGQDFRGVHLQLDEITDQVRLWYDEVAERLATLDVAPDGRLSTIAATSPLPAAGGGWQRDVEAVVAMRDRLTEVAGRIERRAAESFDADLVTQGLLLEIAGGLAKHAWMLRVQAR
jgi:starvation-inducible DNA-binding protein